MRTILISLGLVVAIVLGRLLPHMSNFTPVLALILCAGLLFQRKSLAALAVLLGLAISDAWIGIYDNSMLFVYFGYACIFASGFSARGLRHRMNSFHVVGGSLIAATVFYLVSNFGVWMHSGMYLRTLDGLIDCYVMGIPFFRNTMISTMLFSGVFFTAFQYLKKPVPQVSKQKVKAKG